MESMGCVEEWERFSIDGLASCAAGLGEQGFVNDLVDIWWKSEESKRMSWSRWLDFGVTTD